MKYKAYDGINHQRMLLLIFNHPLVELLIYIYIYIYINVVSHSTSLGKKIA